MVERQGIIRGEPITTTVANRSAPCPLDCVNRHFKAPAPNMPSLSDFICVATWQGFVYVAFVIDALNQTHHDRRPIHRGGLVHHSIRSSQYVSIRYSERLAEVGIELSVGSVVDSYGNALAETINDLFKAEAIHRRGPWRNFEAM